MSAPKNMTELRDRLLESFERVEKDPKRLAQSGELANTAGKIMQSVKLQLEYAIMRGEEPDVPFIGKTSGVSLKPGVQAKLLKA